MRKLFPLVACFLHICLSGCMDYVKLEKNTMLGDLDRFPPVIDTKYLIPEPSRLVTEAISIGKNCKGQVFKVPVEDRNIKKDRLYYLWFIDNELALPRGIIEPSRESAILALNINEQFLLSHFENKIPADFFSRKHVIDFYVSDVDYTIPESRYIDDAKTKKKEQQSDYAYWIVSFSNEPC